ncbi:hypothetical protein A6C57_23475 [Fibrella sp. ES10-3-2-2]|nr:hypothetical protein A6C57_23475 [Fibrella sp. ES10-3-2-2]
MKVKDLFKKMATRAGIAETDAKLTEVIDALPDLDVDDELVANPLTQNLITFAEAEADTKIKGKYTAEALNGIDALLNPVLADFLDQSEIDALKGDKVTTKKLTKLLDKAKAIKAAGGSAADATKAITDLNNEIAKLKTDKDSEFATLISKHERERYFDRLAAKVTSRNDVTDYAKAKEGKRVLSDFEDTLESVGGVLDIKTGKVMKKDDPTLPLFIDNKAADADMILNKTLTDNQYIKKSDPVDTTILPVEQKNQQQGVNTSVSKNLASAKASAKTE